MAFPFLLLKGRQYRNFYNHHENLFHTHANRLTIILKNKLIFFCVCEFFFIYNRMRAQILDEPENSHPPNCKKI